MVLIYDDAVLQYQSANLNPLISSADYNCGIPGQFRLGHFVSEALNVPDDEVLFTLHFSLKPGVSGNTNLSWSSVPGECEIESFTAFEAYSATFNDLSGAILPAKPVINVTKSLDYCTIQEAVAAANTGDEIRIANGTYYITSTLSLNKGLTIIGESEAGVIINTTGTGAGWGINPNKSNTSLSNFTIVPNGATNGGFPIHVAENVTPGTVISNITLSHITIDGAYRTAFDFMVLTIFLSPI